MMMILSRRAAVLPYYKNALFSMHTNMPKCCYWQGTRRIQLLAHHHELQNERNDNNIRSRRFKSFYITDDKSSHTKPKNYSRKPGMGGTSEEKAISAAIRTIRQRNYQIVIEVMNACHVDWAERQLPIRKDGNMHQIWARVLTHSDLLSEEALRYQMERAASIICNHNSDSSSYQIPVVALNLQDTTNLKQSYLRQVMEMLYGSKIVVTTMTPELSSKLLVCGVPNAGKSSLIYPLTKHRTLSVKKKKGSYHLPSINATAGWTMGTKSHVFDIKIPRDNDGGRSSTSSNKHKTESVSLDDTPGLRPRLENLTEKNDELARWLCTRGMKAPKGMLSKTGNDNYHTLERNIQQILWRGLKRHADISSQPLFDELESPDALWEHYLDNNGTQLNSLDGFIRTVTSGVYGGYIIEEEEHTIPTTTTTTTKQQEQQEIHVNQDSTIVAINQSAKLLTDIGSGRVTFDRSKHSMFFLPRFDNRISRSGNRRRQEERDGSHLSTMSSPSSYNGMNEHNKQPLTISQTQQQKPKNSRLQRLREHSSPVPKKSQTSDNSTTIKRLPEHMQRPETCMKCAGFLKSNKFGELRGTSYQSIGHWRVDDICSFYSRIVEVFNADKSRHMKHLLLNSMVLTIKQKLKLTSQKKVWKNEVRREMLKKFPIPSENRPMRFRSDQPIPLKPFACTNRSNSSCKKMKAKFKECELG